MPRIMDWHSVWERLKRAGYRQLFEFQEKAIAAFIKGQDVLVKAPTGAGKTLIPLICATFMLRMKKRCVFVVPTRRLIDQTCNRLTAWFDSLPRYRGKYSIVRVTGDDRPSHRKIKKAEIIVTTFESLNGMLVRNYEYSLLKKVGLIVVDEMQYIGKINRGARLEDIIVKTRSWLRSKPQMLYLTAMIKNLAEVADWLKAELIETDERQSEIITSISRVDNEDECMTVIARLVKETYKLEVVPQQTDIRCVLVFCATRNGAEVRAKKLVQMFEERGYDIAVSYSHAGLSPKVRQERMVAFQKGDINVLFTTEYKEGISAPILRVIIADADTDFFDSPALESMVGRTARPEYYIIGYADMIVRKELQTFFGEKRITITEKGIDFEEERLRSRAKWYMREIILHRVSRGAVSIGPLLNYIKTFYMYHENLRLIKRWSEILKNELCIQKRFMINKHNRKKLLSLLDNNDDFDELEKEGYQQFVVGFLITAYNKIVAQYEDKKGKPQAIGLFLDVLDDHLKQEQARYKEKLKQDVKLYLRELKSSGLVERVGKHKKGGNYRATKLGRWTSQFLLPAKMGVDIHEYLQRQQFYSIEDAYGKITNVIAKNVHKITEKYSPKHYFYFIKALAQEIDLDEAALQVGIRLGDAAGGRRTAAWIAEAVRVYLEEYNPLIAEAAENISQSLIVKEKGEIGPKTRRYMIKKPQPYPGIQHTIRSALELGKIVTYDELHELVTACHGESVSHSTVVWNVLNMGITEEVVRFSRGQGVGRPVCHICSKDTKIPEYMRTTCGSCGFRIQCPSQQQKERIDQRFTCELRLEYNNQLGRHAVNTDITLNTGACEHYNSSRTRRIQYFKAFKKNAEGNSICYVCEKELCKIPTSYSEFTVCPNCSSKYCLRHDGRIKVEPGVRDLFQQNLKFMLKKSFKTLKVFEKEGGWLKRKHILLTVKEGDVLAIKGNMIDFVSKPGSKKEWKLHCRLDAIKRVRLIGEVKLPRLVHFKLKDRIVYGRERDDSLRVPFEEYTVPRGELLSDLLKEKAESLRIHKNGVLLAWQLVMGKKASNALLTLHTKKEGLLEPVDADMLFRGQMNVVAHSVIHWTGSRKNLLSYEAHGEKLAWQLWKLILQDTVMPCRSRTYDRYVPSMLFMGEVKARSPFSAGINALKRHLLHACRETLWKVGFAWSPGELVLHHRKNEKQRIHIGAVLDFRELFLPLFRYAYVKACKKDELTEEDFTLEHTDREEVYLLKESGKTKIKELFYRLMDEIVYYDNDYMTVREAMDRCARSLAGFLLEVTPFIPFVCAWDEGQFQEIYEVFRSIELFCEPVGKGPPVPMTRLLT